MIATFLRWLGFGSYVKLAGKGFHNLTAPEVAAMIDAYLTGEESKFAQNALYEFLLMQYKSASLQAAQRDILGIDEKCKNDTQPDGLATECGRRLLGELADRLRLADQ